MTLVVVAVIAVALLIALTVWKSRRPSPGWTGQFGMDTAGPRGRGGPAGSDRFGGGFGGGWDGTGGAQ
jgi:hypothetical protein